MIYYRFHFLFFCLCLVILFSIFYFLDSRLASATEFTSTNFRVLDPIIGIASSTEMSSANFRLIGTVGQSAIGTSTATNFNISSGFLYFPFVKAPTLKAQAGDGRVALYWSKESGFLGWTVGGYSIGRSTTSGGPYTYESMGSAVTSSATTTTTTTTTTTNGTTYYFVVVAEDLFGNFIATSSEVSVTPSASYYNLTTADFQTTIASSTAFIGPSSSIKVDLTIPADVLSSGDVLHPVFTSQTKSLATSDKPLPSGKLGASTFYDFSWFKISDLSQVTSFDKSVTLKFTYTDADISGIDESTLAPYRWNGSSWVALSGAVIDTAANTVTVNTTSFSTFGLLGSAPAPAPTPAPSPAPSGGGGGGGGGGGLILTEPTPTKIILKGKAYPIANVTIFKDGSVVATLKADENGNFEHQEKLATGGIYTFSLYAIDSENRRSLTTSFTTSVSRGFTATISDIVIAPTVSADKSQVKQGNDIKFFGYGYPNSEVNVIINSEEIISDKTRSEPTGYWNYLLNSEKLERGDHTTKTQVITPDSLKSQFSESVAFRVGDSDVAFRKPQVAAILPFRPTAPPTCNKNGDINNDGKVNLIDFSIMLFFWNQRNPKNICADINGDGVVNLFDFSIMLFWWTG